MKIENRLLKSSGKPIIKIDPGPLSCQQQLCEEVAQPDLPQFHQIYITQLKSLLIKQELVINLLAKYELIKKQNSPIAQDIYQLKIRRYYINKLGILNQSQILRRVRLKKEKKKGIKNQSHQSILIKKNKMEDQLFSEIRNILKNQPRILKSETTSTLSSFSHDLSNQILGIKGKVISIESIKQIKKQISQLPIYQTQDVYHSRFNHWIPIFNQMESQEELSQGSHQLLGSLDYAVINELNKAAFKLSIIIHKQQRQLIVFDPDKIDQMINYILTIKNITSIRAEWSNPNCQNEYYLSQYISMNRFRFKQWILERIPYSIPQIFDYDKDKFNNWLEKIKNKEKNFNKEDIIIFQQITGCQILKIQGNRQRKRIKIKEFENSKLEVTRSQRDPSQIVITVEGINLSEKEIVIKQINIEFS